MATIEELVIKLSAETTELRAELKAAQVTVEKSANTMSKAIDNFAKDGQKSTSFFQDAWSTMVGFIGGQAVLSAIGFAVDSFKTLFNFLVVDGINAASQTQAAMNELLGSLSRSGQLATGAKDRFEEFAGALQQTTKFGDDAVLSSAALIQNIARLGESELKNATSAAVDFAAAMNLDLNTASQLVGKAIEGNVGALRRYGVTVEEGSTKSQTLANVLEALNGRFGGAAAAQLQTYDGALAALSNQFDDLTKVFGQGIVENRTFINVINSVREVLGELIVSLDPQKIRIFFGEALTSALKFASYIEPIAQTVVQSFNYVIDIVQSLGMSIGAVASAALQVAQGNFSGAAEVMKSAWADVKQEFVDSSQANSTITAIGDALLKIGESAQIGLAETQMGLTATVEPANQARDAMVEYWNATKAAEDQAKSFAMGIMESTVTTSEANAIQLENYQLLLDQQLISQEEFGNARLELLAQKQAEEQALLEQGLAINKASTETAAAARQALANKQALELAKTEEDISKKKFEEEQKRLAMTSQFFGNLSVLSQTGNKELAAIGKASAIAQATIDGFAAVQKALASAPPPFNFALAASVGIATAANVAKIASTPLATGIDSVPGIGSADTFPAVLAPGERVVPAETNQDLTRFLQNQQQSQGPTINVNVVMNDVFQADPREMGLKIIQVINEAAEANNIKILGNSIT